MRINSLSCYFFGIFLVDTTIALPYFYRHLLSELSNPDLAAYSERSIEGRYHHALPLLLGSDSKALPNKSPDTDVLAGRRQNRRL